MVGCGPPVPEILQHPEEGKENAWVAPAQGMGLLSPQERRLRGNLVAIFNECRAMEKPGLF